MYCQVSKTTCLYTPVANLDILPVIASSTYRLFFLRSIAQIFTQIFTNFLSVDKLNKLGKFMDNC